MSGRRLGAGPVLLLAATMLWASAASAQQPPTLEGARALYDAGRLTEARTMLEELSRTQLSDPSVLLLLGVVERTTGHLSEAIASLERAAALDPASTPAAVELATTLAWHGDLDRAVELYREVLARDPSHLGARVGLGFALAWQGHLHEARLVFRELNGAHPESVDVWTGLGFVDRASLRRDDAEAEYRRALELAPQNKDTSDALREVLWDRRAEVRLLGGGSVIPGAAREPEARMDFTYAVSPGVTIGGGYQRYAFGAVLPIGGIEPVVGRTEDSLEASVIVRPSRRFTLGTSIYTFFSKEERHGLFWEEAVFAITPRIALIGNFRPAFSSTDPHWLLAGAVGAAVAPTSNSRISVRALIAADTAVEPRLTLLADYGASVARRFLVQVTVAHSSSDEQFAFTSVSGAASWLMTPSVGLAVLAYRRIETFQRTRILLGVRVRR